MTTITFKTKRHDLSEACLTAVFLDVNDMRQFLGTLQMSPVDADAFGHMVKSHAGVVEALEAAEPWLMRITDEVLDGEGSRPQYVAVCEQIRTALAAAKGDGE